MLDRQAFKTPNGTFWPVDGHHAFVPNELPRSLDYTHALVMALSNADRALAELRGLCRAMSNPYLLIPLFMRREAVLSSKIEGTQTTFQDLAVYEAGQRLLYFDRAAVPGDAQEVFNYIGALQHGLKRLNEIPVSLRLIKELHEILLTGVRGDYAHPGEFRDGLVWIGPAGSPVETAYYVAPPRNALKPLLDNFEKSVHERERMPPLIWLAVLHYQFEAIHPFLDGNGRIGRLLISLLLSDWDLMPQPLLYLSAYLEANRITYYERLMAVSSDSAWEDWILFFLKGVESQATDAMARATRLQDLQADYRDRVQSGKRASALGLRAVDSVFDTPALSISMLAKELAVPYHTARFQVSRLVDLEILRRMDRSAKEQLFVAPEVLSVIEAPHFAD